MNKYNKKYLTKKCIKKRNKRTIKNKNFKMKGGNNELFFKKYNNNDDSIIEIGRGAAGTVYKDIEQSDIVFKVSSKDNVCRDWLKEKKIYNKIQDFNIDSELCKIVKLKDFSLFDKKNKCVLVLNKVNNPIDSNLNYTIHPLFGENTYNSYSKGRGRYMGIQQLMEYGLFNNENIKEYIAELGTIIGKLHYVVKNDGFDLEIFVGRDEKDNTIKLYIADFDLSNMIENYDQKTISNLEWSLSSIAYFPYPDEQPELYEIFKNSYLDIATKENKQIIAEKVLELYI